MSESSSRNILTRREALLLSATAGVGIAAGKSAFASDSIKTATHQERSEERRVGKECA